MSLMGKKSKLGVLFSNSLASISIEHTGFFNPVKSNVFLGEAYSHPTRNILVAFFHLVIKEFG